MNEERRQAAVWAALEKIAAKETRRDLLDGGAQHEVKVRIAAEVDGDKLTLCAAGSLTVNHDQTVTASSAPPYDHLVAHLLGLMPKTRRAAVLRELPDDFAGRGGRLPEVTPAELEAAQQLLGRLRARVEQKRRGAVSCQYSLS